MHVSPGHFYSPIPPASDIERHLNSIEDNPISVFGVDLRSDDILRMWKDLTPFMLDCPFPEQPTPPYRYCFSAIPYSWGDALVYHAMLRRFRPSKVIEIGSGWSTACALDTNKHFLNGETEIKCIEPYPITVRHALKEDISSVTLIESDLQKVPISEFSSLKANDILFIDSTHVLRTGSDVAYEFLEVLPRLVPGVVVHIHDIFWPFEYPRDWLINEKRAWNELYLVRLMLLQSDRWEVLMFNDYMGKQYHDVVQRSVPNFLRNPGGGLWLLSK